jgi:AraC-like DNA-binding protein
MSKRTTSAIWVKGIAEMLAADAHSSYRAREAIIRRLPDGEPRRDQVAGDLGMSERTLQRRLEAEATSFIELLDGTRRELADQYLGRLHLTLAQAAYLLGFADQSSFFRVRKCWFALSPGQYRNQLLGQSAERPGGLECKSGESLCRAPR